MRIRQAVAGSHAGGVREVNEDAVLRMSKVPLYAVADGTGGAGVGDLAAAMTLQHVRDAAADIRTALEAVAADRSTANRLALGRLMDRLFNDTSDAIRKQAEASGQARMGASLVLAMVVRTFAYIAHIGDTRAYLLRQGTLTRLTEDHSVAELRFRRGRITREEYETSPDRRVLYQALGAGFEVEVDVSEVRLAGDDLLMICSDGVAKAIGEEAMLEHLDPTDLVGSLRELLSSCIRARSADNVSAVLIGFAPDPGDEPLTAVTTLLQNVFLFEGLSERELALVAPYLEEVVVEKGTTICSEGDPADAFHVLLDGRVRVSRGHTVIADVKPGAHFGELALTRSVPRETTVRALTTVRMFSLTRNRFDQLVQARPMLGARLAVRLVDVVGERLRDLSERLDAVQRAARGELRTDVVGSATPVLAPSRSSGPNGGSSES